MSGKLLLVHQDDRLIWTHRRGLIRAAVVAGWEVHMAGPDSGWLGRLAREGVVLHDLPLFRSISPLQNARARTALEKLIGMVNPSAAMLINLRTCLQCAEVITRAGIPAVYLISGLGLTGNLLPRYVARRLKKYLAAPNSRTQVQNPDDFEFLRHRCGCPTERITMLPGAGVDFQSFQYQEVPTGIPVVLYAGRLLKNKGIELLVEASKRQTIAHRLILAGERDPFNPASVSVAQLKRWAGIDHVEVKGFVEEMPALIAEASVVCLPTWYPEGLPRILTEAASCGRAVIASNTPACREAVIQGETGLLVEPKCLQSLTSALEYVLSNPEQLRVMGSNGRRLAESKFEDLSVNSQAIADLERLG